MESAIGPEGENNFRESKTRRAGEGRLDCDELTEDGDALLVVDERSAFDASPRAELAVLANDRVQHDGVFLLHKHPGGNPGSAVQPCRDEEGARKGNSTSRVALSSTIASLTRAPNPILTLAPIETFGPILAESSISALS